MTPPDSGAVRDWLRNYVRKNGEFVSIPRPLAQRILAALELHGASGCDHCEACARDLRAAVERKP